MLERSGAFFFLTVWPIHQTNEGSVGKDQGPRKFMYGGAEHFFLFLFFFIFYRCFFLLLFLFIVIWDGHAKVIKTTRR